jgi:site-specific recombinase XerD
MCSQPSATGTPIPSESRAGEPLALTPAQALLRKLVLDTVASPHSKRNYAKALDDLFQFCASRPLSRSLLMEWRAGMESLSPSTINVRLSAVRKLVGEARRAGMIGQEEATSLTEIPNISQKGTRLGNWLTREQAKELLAVPDRSTLKGKRDYVILALLVGCALRRNELAELDVETIQGSLHQTSKIVRLGTLRKPIANGKTSAIHFCNAKCWFFSRERLIA